jgi:hypothetical protein
MGMHVTTVNRCKFAEEEVGRAWYIFYEQKQKKDRKGELTPRWYKAYARPYGTG